VPVSPATKHDKLAAAVAELGTRIKEIMAEHPRLEIRSVCFHRENPETGGKWYVRVRGHVKGQHGPIEIML
jgi:hypothetical protein